MSLKTNSWAAWKKESKKQRLLFFFLSQGKHISASVHWHLPVLLPGCSFLDPHRGWLPQLTQVTAPMSPPWRVLPGLKSPAPPRSPSPFLPAPGFLSKALRITGHRSPFPCAVFSLFPCLLSMSSTTAPAPREQNSCLGTTALRMAHTVLDEGLLNE